MRVVPELLATKLKRLRGDISVSALSRKTVRPGYEGVPERTIQLWESKPGRIPDADMLEAVAGALGVDPGEFYEWPIAAARRLAASTPEVARRREADALRKRAAQAQRQAGHPEDDPDTSEVPKRRRNRAS